MDQSTPPLPASSPLYSALSCLPPLGQRRRIGPYPLSPYLHPQAGSPPTPSRPPSFSARPPSELKWMRISASSATWWGFSYDDAPDDKTARRCWRLPLQLPPPTNPSSLRAPPSDSERLGRQMARPTRSFMWRLSHHHRLHLLSAPWFASHRDPICLLCNLNQRETSCYSHLLFSV